MEQMDDQVVEGLRAEEDQLVAQDWMDLLDHLERMDRSDLLDPQGPRESMEREDLMDPMERREFPVTQEYQASTVQKVSLVFRAHLGAQASLVEMVQMVRKESKEYLVPLAQLDPSVLVAHLETQDYRDLTVPLAPEAQTVTRESLVEMASVEREAPVVNLVEMVLLVLRELLEREDHLVCLVSMDLVAVLENVAPVDHLEHLGHKVLLERQGAEGLEEHRAVLVSLVTVDFQVLVVQEEKMVFLDKMDELVVVDPWEKSEIRVSVVKRELQEDTVTLVSMVMLVYLAKLEILVLLESLEVLAPLELLVSLERQVLMDCQVKMASEEHLARLDQMALQDNQVLPGVLAVWVLPDLQDQLELMELMVPMVLMETEV